VPDVSPARKEPSMRMFETATNGILAVASFALAAGMLVVL
jgi:hypothetical protein